MDNDDELVGARLEEEMLDVAEQNINLVTTVVAIAQTVLVNLHFTRNALAVKSRSYKNGLEPSRLSIYTLIRTRTLLAK